MKLATTAAAPEAKVAASAVIGYAVSLVIQILAAYIPHFHAPPATLVALIVTTLSAIAGWLAPHTSRPTDATSAPLASPGAIPVLTRRVPQPEVTPAPEGGTAP